MIDQLPPLVWGAVIASVSSLLVLIVTQCFNLRSQSKQLSERRKERHDDNREWYRRTVFEARLKAAQEAYGWTIRLSGGINSASPAVPDSENNEALRQLCRQATDWYASNAINLYDGLPERSSFVGLINEAAMFSRGGFTKEMPGPDVWRSYGEAIKEIQDRVQALQR
ncbi:MAG: hypothetical protein Q8R28_23665, partial [Dehalococcoidia bacterium]|nr:hypothetical protein [Dehalococcoidia bacterium]